MKSILIFFAFITSFQSFSLPLPGVECTNYTTGDRLKYYSERNKQAVVWFNEKVYTNLKCNRIYPYEPRERGPYGGAIGKEGDKIFLSFGMSSYGQRTHGSIYNVKIKAIEYDYCTIF